MSTRNPRNHLLLSQIPDSNPFKKALAPRAFDVGNDYERDMEALGLNRNWSAEGRRNEALKHTRSTLRDLKDLKKPLEEYSKQTETMRAAVKMPAFDKADIVGAMNRRELREASRAMSSGQRAGKLAGSGRSVDFIDAVLEQEAWVSGIDIFNPNELQVFEAAKLERLRDHHAPMLDAIAARETVKSEIQMVVDVLRGDIAADSGLEPREFEAEAKAVESGIGALWLKRSTDFSGKDTIVVIDPKGGLSRAATPLDMQNGHFFASHEEYLASRAA